MTTATPSKVLLLILLMAAVWRTWLISTDSAAFQSDEAIVALMARHITQGEAIPTFYYGQAYMGSLDALLVAGGFLLFGESVETIRIVQAGIYLLTIWTGYLLAREITQRSSLALMTALLLALPTMLGTLYTTITLGGYNEIILFGNLLLLFGWRLSFGGTQALWEWGALGIIAGLGWWTNAAIITPLAVTALLLARFAKPRLWRAYGLAALLFFVGSAAWWVYNLRHDWAAWHFLFSDQVNPNVEALSFLEKLAAFFVIGLSGLYGFRFPWQETFQTGILALGAAAVYLLMFTEAILVWARHRWNQADGWVGLCFGIMAIVFMLSSFQDATGRYLLPLWIPSVIGLVLGVDRLRRFHDLMPSVGLALLVAFYASGVLRAAHSEEGLQAQLDQSLITHPADEAALLAFLADHDYHYGYTTYWITYRLMFLTGETLLFDASLPYDKNGYRPNNNRYPPYVEAVANTERVVWVTHNFPALDRLIERRLQERGIAYQTQTFGTLRVFYDFSERIAPAELGLTSPRPLSELESCTYQHVDC